MKRGRKRTYYPNNWQQYKDSPDDMFINHTYEEFMDWKIEGWYLPSSVSCIIRVEEADGTIQEYIYQTQGHAKRKVKQLVKDRLDFVICDNESIHNMEATK